LLHDIKKQGEFLKDKIPEGKDEIIFGRKKNNLKKANQDQQKILNFT
jgi:hypothetical protein